MSKKSRLETTENHPEKDLAAFEALPDKTKELMKLKDQLEKTSGPGEVAITRKLQDKNRKPQS